MMKPKYGYLAALILLLCASTANAALSKGQWLVGPSAGVSIPVGDYKDFSKVGFAGGVDADYVLSPSGSIGANLGYNRNSYSDDFKTALFLATGVPIDGHFTIMHYGAHGRFFLSPESKTRPYITVGAGFYNFKASAEYQGVSGSTSETKGGINGGFGVLFDAGTSAHVGVQGAYNDIFTPDKSTQFINAHVIVLFDLGKK